MRKFSRKDTKFLIIIFLLLILLIGLNLRVSLRKGRDNIRRTDMSALQGALDKYLAEYKVFPESKDGKIVGCMGDDTYFDEKKGVYQNLIECQWGQDSFQNLEVLPRDPKYQSGRNYLYLSNSKNYQIFTALEGNNSSEYTDISIISRNLICGNQICNYGKSYGSVPVGISLEEYEEKTAK